jgi:hypothetical protein
MRVAGDGALMTKTLVDSFVWQPRVVVPHVSYWDGCDELPRTAVVMVIVLRHGLEPDLESED